MEKKNEKLINLKANYFMIFFLPSILPLLCHTLYIGPSTFLALQFLQYSGDATYTLEIKEQC